MAAMKYIESHLDKRIDLDTVANAVHYSKYYLHRMFTNTVGFTMHDYIQRRQLTEAAKLLVFSQKPIIDIALISGYDSQQSFTLAFKSMYKKAPAQYRKDENFYPLQLAFILKTRPSKPEIVTQNISYVTTADIPDWIQFVSSVIDGFPHLELIEHLEQLKKNIAQKQALLMRDGNTIIGAVAFCYETGSINFLGVHPQYRQHGVSKAFLDLLMNEILPGRELSITTFREGDKADAGQREAYKRLGFAEAELLTEYGYPTQRLILPSTQRSCFNE